MLFKIKMLIKRQALSRKYNRKSWKFIMVEKAKKIKSNLQKPQILKQKIFLNPYQNYIYKKK